MNSHIPNKQLKITEVKAIFGEFGGFIYRLNDLKDQTYLKTK